MKVVLLIFCCVLVSTNLAEAFVSPSAEENSEFANSDLTNDTQPIEETIITFTEGIEYIGTNAKSGGVTSGFCFRNYGNYRGDISGVAGKCLDVKNSKTSNGTPILLFSCSKNKNQRLQILSSDNSIRVLGKCLDAGPAANDGNFVRIHDCHRGTHQQWIITSSGQIVNVKGDNCLHATTTLNGAAIHVNQCDGSANQAWNFAS